MTDTLFLADFRQAAASEGCPFCALLTETTQRYVRSLLRESVLSPKIHQQLAVSRGFCRTHSGLLGEGEGTAILYSTVLQSLRQDLTAGLAQQGTTIKKPSRWRAMPAPFGALLRERLVPTSTCLVCEHQSQASVFALSQLIEHLNEAGPGGELAQLYHQGPGACLPHFFQLLELSANDTTTRWLAELQLRQLTALEAQLEEARRGTDKTNSVKRTIALTTGLPSAFGG